MTTICSCMDNLSNEILKDFIEVCEPVLDSLACLDSDSLDKDSYVHLSTLQREALKVFNSRKSVTLLDFDKYD